MYYVFKWCGRFVFCFVSFHFLLILSFFLSFFSVFFFVVLRFRRLAIVMHATTKHMKLIYRNDQFRHVYYHLNSRFNNMVLVVFFIFHSFSFFSSFLRLFCGENHINFVEISSSKYLSIRTIRCEILQWKKILTEGSGNEQKSNKRKNTNSSSNNRPFHAENTFFFFLQFFHFDFS